MAIGCQDRKAQSNRKITSINEGWYPDPQAPEQQRYWSGTEWTDHVARANVTAGDSKAKTSLKVIVFTALGALVLLGFMIAAGAGVNVFKDDGTSEALSSLPPELVDENYVFGELEQERLEAVTEINETLYGPGIGESLARVTTRIRAFKQNNVDYSTVFEDPKGYTEEEYLASGWFLIEAAYLTEGFTAEDMTKYEAVTQNAIAILEEPPVSYDSSRHGKLQAERWSRLTAILWADDRPGP